MKKKILFPLFFAMVGVSCFAFTACDEKISTTSDDEQNLVFYLNEDKQSYSVTTGSEKTPANVVIPETVKGKPITVIQRFSMEGISTITIPDTITLIDDSFDEIFYEFKNLTYYVEDEGDSYYLGNENNHHVILVKSFCNTCVVNDDTKVVVGNAFENSVLSFELPKSVAYICPEAFSSLTALNRPINDKNENGMWDEGERYVDRNLNGQHDYGEEYYTGIQSMSFHGAEGTDGEYYKIENNTLYTADMTRLIFSAENAFPTLPDTLIAVERDAFINTSFSSLEALAALHNENGSLYLPSKSNPCFMLISSTKDATISDQTKILYSFAFRKVNVDSITVPDSVIQIMSKAFYGHGNIKEIHISTDNWYIASDWCNGRAWDLAHATASNKDNHLIHPKSTQIKEIIRNVSDPERVAKDLNRLNETYDYRRYLG